MDGALVKEIGTKALLVGASGLLIFWTFNAIKLVIGARGINPLVKKFFNQIAEGRIDAAYLLTSKNYRQHVTRQDFLNDGLACLNTIVLTFYKISRTYSILFFLQYVFF